MANMTPIRIAILAMGGQGGGVLTNWLVDLAISNGFQAQASSVPGVAQRTGATLYYVEVFLEQESQKRPVLGLMPFDGEVDLVVAAELMEAARALQRNLISSDKTTAIVSSHRVLSINEKSSRTDGTVNSSALIEPIVQSAKKCIYFDMEHIANEHQGVISAALFGAIAGSKRLPFSSDDFCHVIKKSGTMVDTNIKIFDASRTLAEKNAQLLPSTQSEQKSLDLLPESLAAIAHTFPSPLQQDLSHGLCHCYLFGGIAYAEKYAETFTPYYQQLITKDGKSANSQFLSEFSRYLALFMCYEDVIHVARQKISRARIEDIIETMDANSKVYYIHDFFHPRVNEIVDILPQFLGRWVLRNRVARTVLDKVFCGSKTLCVNSLSGFIPLKILASARFLRPFSHRFKQEQLQLRHWLDQINRLLTIDISLALAYVQMRRIVKGYSHTYERTYALYSCLENYVCINASHIDSRKIEELTNIALHQDLAKLQSSFKEDGGVKG